MLQRRMLHQRFIRFYRKARKMGLIAALRLWALRAGSALEIRLKGVGKPFLIRGNSSDIDVFSEIFIEEEYACLSDIETVGLIIDAGANVGYSSIYFLSIFPDCRIVAVEPDPENFTMLKRNLAPYADRVELLNTGIWSHSTQLLLESVPYRDGREWARQVRECQNNESGDMNAISIDEIINVSGYDRVSLLKMDIEGAESMVFAAGACKKWLSKIDAIAIELHDDSQFGHASNIFYAAIEEEDFVVSRSGELVICRRPKMSARSSELYV